MALTKKEVIEYIKKLPTPELSELIQELQEELGITPEPLQPQQVFMGAPPVTMGVSLEEAEDYAVVLREVGANRLEVIKTLRALTGKGLAECKGIVESLPRTILEGVSKKDASQWEKQLASSGALIEIKRQ